MNDGSARPDLEASHAPEQNVSLRRIPALLIIRGVLMSLIAIGLVGGLHVYLAHRLVGGLLGFQYAADCWAVSVALQKYTNYNGTTQPTTGTRVLVQLQLDGLSRIDNGLLQQFRANVPGYSTPTLPAPTSRFTDYP